MNILNILNQFVANGCTTKTVVAQKPANDERLPLRNRRIKAYTSSGKHIYCGLFRHNMDAIADAERRFGVPCVTFVEVA